MSHCSMLVNGKHSCKNVATVSRIVSGKPIRLCTKHAMPNCSNNSPNGSNNGLTGPNGLIKEQIQCCGTCENGKQCTEHMSFSLTCKEHKHILPSKTTTIKCITCNVLPAHLYSFCAPCMHKSLIGDKLSSDNASSTGSQDITCVHCSHDRRLGQYCISHAIQCLEVFEEGRHTNMS